MSLSHRIYSVALLILLFLLFLFPFAIMSGNSLMLCAPFLSILDYSFLSLHLTTISVGALCAAFVAWVFKSFIFHPEVQRNCAHALVWVALGYGVILLCLRLDGVTPKHLMAYAASLPLFVIGFVTAIVGLSRLRGRALKGGMKIGIAAIILGGSPVLAAGIAGGAVIVSKARLYIGLPKIPEAALAAGRKRFPEMNFEADIPSEQGWAQVHRPFLTQDLRSASSEVTFKKSGTENMLKFVSTRAGARAKSSMDQLVRSAIKLQVSAVGLKGYSPSDTTEVEINGHTFQHHTLSGLVGRDSFFGEYYSILHEGEFFQILGITKGIRRTTSFSAELRNVVESFSFLRSATPAPLKSSDTTVVTDATP